MELRDVDRNIIKYEINKLTTCPIFMLSKAEIEYCRAMINGLSKKVIQDLEALDIEDRFDNMVAVMDALDKVVVQNKEILVDELVGYTIQLVGKTITETDLVYKLSIWFNKISGTICKYISRYHLYIENKIESIL